LRFRRLGIVTGARVLPGFQPLFAPSRIDKGGGGGGFLVRTGTAFTKNDLLFIQGPFETISITLLFDGKSTQLINMYKPPGLSNTQFLLFAKQLHIDKNCMLWAISILTFLEAIMLKSLLTFAL
jgi:hypothetical protein